MIALNLAVGLRMIRTEVEAEIYKILEIIFSEDIKETRLKNLALNHQDNHNENINKELADNELSCNKPTGYQKQKVKSSEDKALP